MNNGMEKEIFEIYLEDIIPNRFQPRLSFDDKELSELAASIKEHGIIQPLVLRKVGDKYEIIAGERRYKAAGKVGLQKVPAIIMNIDDQESAQIAVVENIQRKNLTPLEEARSYKKLLDKNYLTQEQLAARMGKAQATISNKLRLLNLEPEVQDALLNERISERHARSLLSLKDANSQKEILERIINNKLTVRQTDDLIKAMLGGNAPIGVSSDNTSSGDGDVLEVNSPSILPQIDNFPSININENKEQEMPIQQELRGENMENDEDINKIKEQAVDINQNREAPNINRLLSLNGVGDIAEPITTPPATTVPTNAENKFITSLEDEETDMNMGDNTLGQANEEIKQEIPVINNISIPEPIRERVDYEMPVPTPEPINIPPAMAETSYITPDQRQYIQPERTNDGVIIAPGELKSAINAVRNLTKTLEKSGFIIDEEEFDFEHLYQIIIKINK